MEWDCIGWEVKLSDCIVPFTIKVCNSRKKKTNILSQIISTYFIFWNIFVLLVNISVCKHNWRKFYIQQNNLIFKNIFHVFIDLAGIIFNDHGKYVYKDNIELCVNIGGHSVFPIPNLLTFWLLKLRWALHFLKAISLILFTSVKFLESEFLSQGLWTFLRILINIPLCFWKEL